MESSAKKLVWLHLSDLHAGQRGSTTLGVTYRQAALDDMREMTNQIGKPEVIFFTGDLSFSGQANEFDQVSRVLDEVREATGSDPCVIPVPGNHDMSRPAGGSMLAAALRRYWDDSALRDAILDGDMNNIEQINAMFKNYKSWVDEQIRPTWASQGAVTADGLLAGDLRLSVHLGGFHLGVLGLNSAFLQVDGENYQRRLALEPEQAGPDVASWADEHDATFLLMHHPPSDWLRPSSFEKFREFIYPSTRFMACLCGHMHEAIEDESTQRGRTRRYVQAPSLFGLESFRSEGLEDRRCGYTWGVLHAAPNESPELTVWPREAAKVGGDIVVTAAPDTDSGYSLPLLEKRWRRERSQVISGPTSAKWREIGKQSIGRELSSANESYERGEYEQAAEKYMVLLGSIENQAPAGIAELERTQNAARFGVALAQSRLRQSEVAFKYLEKIEPAHLDSDSKNVYARMCASMGLRSQAEGLLNELPADEATAVSQLLIIGEGEVPSGEILDPRVRLASSYALVKTGRFREASELVAEFIASKSANGGIQAQACEILLDCLEATVLGVSGGNQMIESALQSYVTFLEDCLCSKDSQVGTVVGPVILSVWRARFAYLSREPEGLAAAHTRLAQLGIASTPVEQSETDTVFESACAVAELRLAGRLDEARVLLEKHLSEHVGYMPLQWEAAELALIQGEGSTAVEHARRAHALFPGLGQRRLLATALLAAGQPLEVWERRDEFLRVGNLALHLLVAQAATLASLPDAPSAWRDALELDKNSPWARLQLATCLWMLGDEEDAHQEVLELFQTDKGRSLSTKELIRCSVFLRNSPSIQQEELVVLAKAIFRRLEEEKDSEAGSAYLSLYLELNSPEELPRPNYEELESIGAISSFPEAELLPFLEQQHSLDQRLGKAYQERLITAEFYCSMREEPEALFLERTIHRSHILWTPTNAAVLGVAPKNRKILTGGIELLLLDRLDLLGSFATHLGTKGRVVIFEDTYERLVTAPGLLQKRWRPERLAWLRDLQFRITGLAGLELGQLSGEQTEIEWCEERSLTLVKPLGLSGGVQLSAVVGKLVLNGAITTEQGRQVLAGVPAGESEVLPEGEQLALGATQLICLAEAKALEPAIGCFDKLTLTPHGLVALRESVENLVIEENAVRRANSVSAWLKSQRKGNRIVLIPRPVVELPEAPSAPVVCGWVSNALSSRRALELDSELHLLSADHLCSELMVGASPRQLLFPLQFTPETFRKMSSSLQRTRERDVSFGRLALELVGGDRRSEVVETLLDLGFVDACDWQAILAMHTKYNGLDGQVPSGQLDRLERHLLHNDEALAALAQLGVASVYAETIWHAWSSEGEQIAEPEKVLGALLSRLEKRVSGDGLISWFFRLLMGLSLSTENRFDCFERTDNDTYRLSAKSPVGQLWQAAGLWASSSNARISMMDIGCVDLLLTVAEELDDDGLSVVASAPFLLASDAVSPEEFFRPGSLREALAVCSANWKVRPLEPLTVGVNFDDSATRINLEEVLVKAAQTLDENFPNAPDIQGNYWSIPIQIGTKTLNVAVPPAAVILRAAKCNEIAAQVDFGLHDGRMVDPLGQISLGNLAPGRRELAQLSVSSPGHRFRQNPSVSAIWRRFGQPFAFPSSIDDLHSLLSEPKVVLGDRDLADVLGDRVAPGGDWEGRGDARGLLTRAASVPGGEIVMMQWRLSPDGLEDELKDTTDRLLHSEGMPCVRLASDILFAVLVVASQKPETSQAIREAANQALRTAITSKRNGLSGAEPGLLRLAAAIVARCGGNNEAPKERMWLAWKLYDWLARQFDIRHEVPNLAVGPSYHRDLLDPSCVAQDGIDIRLAVLLHPLAAVKAPILSAFLEPSLIESLQELAVRELTSEEREIDDSFRDSPHWSWQQLPISIPGLAQLVVNGLDDTGLDVD